MGKMCGVPRKPVADEKREAPEGAAGDPFIPAARRECFACYDGLVFIGRLEMTSEGGRYRITVSVASNAM
jgi:hypothetical protein